ncbi:MAG: hypothetical protein JO033_18890 [Acidobacteriaceae bacterium]|nr:hypothetical protein [Acidobacteriaceae bacterium]MBV9500803.1 hypothetical protein [Acidobacteriaceae bacterium]
MKKRFVFSGVCAAAMLLVAPNKGTAQSFTVDYFGAADQTYDFVNYGFHGADEFSFASYECANIYVFHDQDPVACGSCFVSPNGSRTVGLHANLIAAPVTGVTPPNGVIKVVYTQYTTNFCDPMAVTAPSPGLKTFRTRGGVDVELDEVPLSGAELAHLNAVCSDIFDILSGSFNITCGSEDPPISVHDNGGQKKKPVLK